MRVIPSPVHGMLDYLIGLALIAAPWLFGFADNETARWVTIAIGAGAILYSLITNYELSVADIIPLPVHLMLDAMSGALLAASPWLFGFSDEVWVPHVVVGLLEIGAALMSRTIPEEDAHELAHNRRRDMA